MPFDVQLIMKSYPGFNIAELEERQAFVKSQLRHIQDKLQYRKSDLDVLSMLHSTIDNVRFIRNICCIQITWN